MPISRSRRHARRAGEARMRQEGDVGERRDQRLHGAEAGQQRRDQHRVDALLAGQPKLRAHCVEVARQARHVARRLPAQRRGAGAHTLGERRIFLVGQPVVVLDEIHPAGGEPRRQRRQPVGRQALRLQRRAGQRPPFRRGAPAQPGDAVARPTERRGQLGRERRPPPAPRRRAARCCRTACSATVPRRRRSSRSASAMRTANAPPPRSAMSVTWPTMSRSTSGASIASSGISTLCSTAIAWARAAIVAASARTW